MVTKSEDAKDVLLKILTISVLAERETLNIKVEAEYFHLNM